MCSYLQARSLERERRTNRQRPKRKNLRRPRSRRMHVKQRRKNERNLLRQKRCLSFLILEYVSTLNLSTAQPIMSLCLKMLTNRPYKRFI